LECASKLKNTYKWELFDLKNMFLVKKMSVEANLNSNNRRVLSQEKPGKIKVRRRGVISQGVF
jgi:hypothetical protein